ncbi:MAG: aminodeoxychorismate synthase component I [Campylobacterota bacterium]|nr:aminodeoxychorismate synthase component I [Campylobacterota bacterium]
MYDELTRLAVARVPFLFYTDFKGEKLHLFKLDELEQHGISYQINTKLSSLNEKYLFQKRPVSFESYKTKFSKVIEKIKEGKTYLLNLTQPTSIECQLTLEEIYKRAVAPFKLQVGNQFTCFSPERFIKIENCRISTFPMKGTIDASIPNAEAKILANPKEMAEHIMIVDLLRNDLGIVAKDIRVDKFRYTEKIKAGKKELIQVSSQISGDLGEDWRSKLGETIKSLLPAGSISGTPKKSTVTIIEEIEGYERGYFTGVFGVYDGDVLESGVMIRFIENQDGKLVYKSGGGITLDSDAESEYKEMIDKIYIV